MTTLSALRTRVSYALSDTGFSTFSSTIVDSWIVEAIRDYSRTFPRRLSTTVATSAGDNQYNLPSDWISIVSVEFPTGDDPPTYLQRVGYDSEAFWDGDNYDILSGDTYQIVLSAGSDTPGSETITIWYDGVHDITLSAGDTLTVPERHEQILILYCVWQAARYLLFQEQRAPSSNSSVLMAQYADAAAMHEQHYSDAMRAARRENSQSARVTWKMDRYDRIY